MKSKRESDKIIKSRRSEFHFRTSHHRISLNYLFYPFKKIFIHILIYNFKMLLSLSLSQCCSPFLSHLFSNFIIVYVTSLEMKWHTTSVPPILQNPIQSNWVPSPSPAPPPPTPKKEKKTNNKKRKILDLNSTSSRSCHPYLFLTF